MKARIWLEKGEMIQAQEAAGTPRKEQEPGLAVVLLAKQPLSPHGAEMRLSVPNGGLLFQPALCRPSDGDQKHQAHPLRFCWDHGLPSQRPHPRGAE